MGPFKSVTQLYTAIKNEASAHFDSHSRQKALSYKLADFDLLSLPLALEFYIPVQHSAEHTLHLHVKACLTESSSEPSDQQSVIPPLVHDVLVRLVAFLQSLPPGLVDKERDLSDRLTQTKEYLELVQVIQRSESRLLAGIGPLPNVDAQVADPEAEDGEEKDEGSHEVDFGFRIRVKKSKVKKVKKEERARTTAIDNQKEQQVSDETFLKKGSYPIPRDSLDIRELKGRARRRLARVYVSFINALRSSTLRSYVCSQIERKLSIPPSSLPPTQSEASTTNESHAIKQAPQLQQAEPEPKALPASFPSIQPLKAARLFECDSSDLGSWQVYFSSRSISHFRQLDKSAMLIVVKKIKEISNGHFSADNMKTLKGTSDIPIFEAKCSRDLRIVYQVDLYNDAELSIQRQILKIWGIVSHAEMDNNRLWTAVANELAEAKTKTYKDRIKERASTRKTTGQGVADVINPMTFPRLVEATTIVKNAGNRDMNDKDWIELHDLLALQKWMPYSRSLINSAAAHFDDATHAFLLSEQEQIVVNEETSCFVIGRSGTGKTSCALFRLIGMEETCRAACMLLRQVFVTKSPVLASKIKDYYLKLRQTLDISNMSAKEIHQANARMRNEEIQLQDQEDDIASLPAKWSELADKHFPLFISFDHLCALIEADLGINRLQGGALRDERKRARQAMQTRVSSSDDANKYSESVDLELAEAFLISATATDQSAWLHHVDAQAFLTLYWPHFDKLLVKGLDPMLCYAEFVGVLQGSELALTSEHGYLSRETYLSLSHRTAATFTHARERIYALFMAYRQKKSARRDWDAADRSFAILKVLSNNDSLPRVHRLYVDEAQDNLLIDAKLLRSLVSDPHGHFWAGDTAQTISASTFRFEDLSAAFYRAEQAEPLVLAGARQAYQPKIYNLLVNYRSHRGITNVAAALVDAIIHFFPSAIDNLGREMGIVDGTLPVIFEGFDNDSDLRLESFLFGAGDTTMEFGAEQCIIVRDERARADLRAKLGDGFGLILTIYESKGTGIITHHTAGGPVCEYSQMQVAFGRISQDWDQKLNVVTDCSVYTGLEFSDVLLYRFFTDSAAAESQWRVLQNMLDEDSKQAPIFDTVKHSVILAELRHLYVAVTRARNRLWIFDTSDRIKPLKRLLSNKGLVRLCRPGDELPEMAVASSQGQWRKTANGLFERKLWSQAANCFARAGELHWRDVALARMQEEAAYTAEKAQKPGKVCQMEFRKAAGMLHEVAQAAQAGNAIFLYRRAATAYCKANLPLQAALCFEMIQDWTSACQLYRKSNAFDDAVRLLQAHPPLDLLWLAKEAPSSTSMGSIDTKEADITLQTSRLHLLKSNNLKKTRELFEQVDDQLEWLEDYGFDTTGQELLESLGQHVRCAEMKLKKGMLDEAARSFINAKYFKQARDCLFEQLLQTSPMGTTLSGDTASREVRTQVKKLLDKIQRIDSETAIATPAQSLLVIAYRCALSVDSSREGVDAADCKQAGLSSSERLLVLDLLLQKRLSAQDTSHEDWQAYIQHVVEYCQALQSVCLLKGTPGGFLALCGLKHPPKEGDSEEDTEPDTTKIIVPLSAPFYAQLPSTAEAAEEGAIVQLQEITLPLSTFFSKRLFELIKDVHAHVSDARFIWPPCMPYVLSKRCPEQDCRRDHITMDHRVHLQDRIIFWSSLLPLCSHLAWLAGRLRNLRYEFEECRRFRRTVLDAFVQILSPSTHASGALQDVLEHSLLKSKIPLELLYNEASDGLFRLDFRIPEHVFITRLVEYSSIATFCQPARFAVDFPFTLAMRRQGAFLKLHDSEKQSISVALYVFWRDIHLNKLVSADAPACGLRLLESVVRHQEMHIYLNGFFKILETIVVTCVLGTRQAGGRSDGFYNITLPESLARQAVLSFSKTQFQMFPMVVDRLCELCSRVAILILTGDRRFYLDGTTLKGTARNFMGARLLQLLALIGFNDTSPRTATRTRNTILNHFVLARKEINTVMSKTSRLPYRPVEDISRYLDATKWEDVMRALGHFGRGKGVGDRLVQLQFGPSKNQPLRGLHRIQANSLDSLYRRWSGLPEQQTAISTFAAAGQNDKAKTDGLIPFQLLTKPKKSYASTVQHSSFTATKETSQSMVAVAEGEVNPCEVPLPEDTEEDFWEDVELVDEILQVNTADQDTSVVLDYAPITEVDTEHSATAHEVAAALRIQQAWERFKQIRAAKAQTVTPYSRCRNEMIQIALSMCTASHAYRYALVNYYPYYSLALNATIAETKKCKEKLSKRLKTEKVDYEHYHERMTAINHCRKKLLDLRRGLDELILTCDLDLLRTTLKDFVRLADETSNAAGNTVNPVVWQEMRNNLQLGDEVFGEAPKPPTAKQDKRPALNDDMDDPDAIDGFRNLED